MMITETRFGFTYHKPHPPPPRRRRNAPVTYPYTAADGRIFIGRGRWWDDQGLHLNYLTRREGDALMKEMHTGPLTMIHGRARG
jgi:hypothetical protein